MAVYKPLADIEVEAFQWVGDPLSNYALPGWANALALHTPTDNTLQVPCWNGTFAAKPGDWVVRGPAGRVEVLPDEMFSSLFDVDSVELEETRQSAEEKTAVAAEARAAAAQQRHEAVKAKVAAKESAAPAPAHAPAHGQRSAAKEK